MFITNMICYVKLSNYLTYNYIGNDLNIFQQVRY